MTSHPLCAIGGEEVWIRTIVRSVVCKTAWLWIIGR
jgi:hypothetical protein